MKPLTQPTKKHVLHGTSRMASSFIRLTTNGLNLRFLRFLPWFFSFAFIRRIIPPLVHTVEDGAIAGAVVAHKNQRERHAMADRQFAGASDNAEAARYSNGRCNQGMCCFFNDLAHSSGSGGVAPGIPRE